MARYTDPYTVESVGGGQDRTARVAHVVTPN